MAKRWTLVLPGVASLLAAGLVACGGGGGPPSVDEYEASVVDARNRTDQALARIQEATSEEDFLDRLDEAGELIEDAALDLRDEGAPARFEDETERLVLHLRELAEGLRGTAEEARTLGFDKLLTGAAGLNFEGWDKANAIFRALRQQGIDVRPLERH